MREGSPVCSASFPPDVLLTVRIGFKRFVAIGDNGSLDPLMVLILAMALIARRRGRIEWPIRPISR
jgi:hypothetical protein